MTGQENVVVLLYIEINTTGWIFKIKREIQKIKQENNLENIILLAVQKRFVKALKKYFW